VDPSQQAAANAHAAPEAIQFEGATVAKLDDHVPFPLALDFSPFACKAAEPVDHLSKLEQPSADSEHAAQLRLYAVVEHQGTFTGGHYVAYVRLCERWHRMSDSTVTVVSEAEVLQVQAFLLFYER